MRSDDDLNRYCPMAVRKRTQNGIGLSMIEVSQASRVRSLARVNAVGEALKPGLRIPVRLESLRYFVAP